MDLSKVDLKSIEVYVSTFQGEIDELYIEEAYYLDGTKLTDDDLDELENKIPDKVYELALDKLVSYADFAH